MTPDAIIPDEIIDPRDTPEFALNYGRPEPPEVEARSHALSALDDYDNAMDKDGGATTDELYEAAEEMASAIRRLLEASPTALRQPIAIRPGDYVAIIYDQPLTRAETAHIKTQVMAEWPGVRVALFSGGATAITVLRPEGS